MKENKNASSILMPKPVSIIDKKGSLRITSETGISCPTIFDHVRQLVLDQFSFTSKKTLITFIHNEKLSNEEYYLEISEDMITIEASNSTGIYYGMQTVRQLMISCDNDVPCCSIKDKPKYPWRGFMIDCSRHFSTIKELKKMIDVAAMHHLNVFHWHLTDDQSWRLQIPSLPLLTEVGARRQHVNYEVEVIEEDYYTEEDVLELVEYAKCRYIDIVPEIEFPGHVRALLASYPEYGCQGKNYKVQAHWGIFEEVLCVGNDSLIPFITEILTYVAKIFPSKYIHIGGDECPTAAWEKCPKCQQKMKELNFSKTNQLQSYITSEICKIVDGLNKIPIGWDEVLDGTEALGLPESLIIMSWRGTAGGIKASALNHKVIMCPNTEGCYFDYKNFDSKEEPGNIGVTTIEDVTNYSPISDEMNKHQEDMVLGGQGNVWTEKIPFGKNLEYMTFPRLSVLAERLWNPQALDSVDERRDYLTDRLRKLDINCYTGPSSKK